MTFLTFSIAGSGSVFFREELADDFHGVPPLRERRTGARAGTDMDLSAAVEAAASGDPAKLHRWADFPLGAPAVRRFVAAGKDDAQAAPPLLSPRSQRAADRIRRVWDKTCVTATFSAGKVAAPVGVLKPLASPANAGATEVGGKIGRNASIGSTRTATIMEANLFMASQIHIKLS